MIMQWGRSGVQQQSTAPGGNGTGPDLGGAPHTHPSRIAPSVHGSNMSVPRNKFEVIDTDMDGVRHNRNWKKWAAGIAAAVTVLALALGLGLGLGLKNNDNNPPPSTVTVVPAPNGSVPTLAASLPWQIMLSETVSLDNSSTDSTAEDANSSDDSAATALVTPNQYTNPNVSLIDIDMFLHQNLTVVRDLRARGMHVICYFSAGSYEDWRPDAWKFKQDDLGNPLDGWPGEYWLDLNSDNVRSIMTARIEIAAQMNCSGIDPDNVDGYDNDNGLDLTQDDSINFMRFLAQEASSYGMMTGLKNAGAIIDDVIDYVQFSVNEQCQQYDECDAFTAFPNASKPVFHIEYPAGDGDTQTKSFNTNTISKYCNIDAPDDGQGFNTVLKYMNLSGWVQYCNGQTYVTDGQ